MIAQPAVEDTLCFPGVEGLGFAAGCRPDMHPLAVRTVHAQDLDTFILATIAVPIVIYGLMRHLHSVRSAPGGSARELVKRPADTDTPRMVTSESRGWERYVWLAGALFVVALVAETIVEVGVHLSLNDSEGKIAAGLQDHHRRLILVACLSILYTPAFVIYLSRLHDLLREHTSHSRFLVSWVLVGGVVWVTLHGVSDIGITGLVGAKIAVAAYSASHDHSGPYSLYLLTFALDSVADVFGSLFMLATGLLLLRTHLLPRWQAWTAILAAPFLFTQAFGLGGVIASFGLILDLIGFLLLLIFVLVSSLTLFARSNPARRTAPAT